MINIIITSYNEPKATLNAVNSFLKQKIKQKFRIIVCDPFPEVGEFLKKNIKTKNLEFFLDPGEGKSYALNLLFEKVRSSDKEDIIILTDGDVFVGENSVNEILKSFKNQSVGCMTGKPVSVDSRKKKYGYWSKLLYAGVDFVRKDLSKDKKFFQCSGYLFAIRNGIINEIPLDVPEDCIIPYLVWKKGYEVIYTPRAEVFVKYPDNWKDWINQRIRTIKAHENLDKLYPDMPRTKSLLNEIQKGALFSLRFPKNIRELYWTFQLFFARLYIYLKAFKEIKKKEVFSDGWRETEISSTKPLD